MFSATIIRKETQGPVRNFLECRRAGRPARV